MKGSEALIFKKRSEGEILLIFAEIILGLEYMHSRKVVADLNISRIYMQKDTVKLGLPTKPKGTITSDVKSLALTLYSLCTRQ